MDNASEQFLTNPVKVQVEEYEQNINDWIQIDYGPRSADVLEDDGDMVGVQQEYLDDDVQIIEEPLQSNSTISTTLLNDTTMSSPIRCPMTNCTWYSEEQDRNSMYLLMRDHFSVHHQEITSICSVCFSVFESQDQLLLHTLNVHSSFQCQFCAQQFESMSELDSHSKTHGMDSSTSTTGVTICSIKRCTWFTEEQDKSVIFLLLKTHANTIHKMNNVCEVCCKIYQNRSVYLKHIRKHHHLIECQICKLNLNSDIEFKEHMNRVHESEPCHSISTSKTTLNDKLPIVKPSKTYTCHVCNCNFFEYEKLRCHLNFFHWISTDINMENVTFTGPLMKRMKCNLCSNQFLYTRPFRSHYNKSHGEIIPRLISKCKKSMKYSCYLCTNKILNLKSMKDHYKSVHNRHLDVNDFDLSNWYTSAVTELSSEEGKLIFSCKLCPQFYSNSTDLNLHITDHHVCGKCSLVLSSMEEKEIHLEEVHTGYCKICNFKLCNSIELLSHVLEKHENVDISDHASVYIVRNSNCDVYHTCKLCSKSLGSLKSMKMHYYWFHNKYVCNQCNLTFENVRLESEHFISTHLTKCNQNVNHVCEICGDYLNNRMELAEHREKHGENVNGFSSDLELKLKHDIELYMEKISHTMVGNDSNDVQSLEKTDDLNSSHSQQDLFESSQKNDWLDDSRSSKKSKPLRKPQKRKEQLKLENVFIGSLCMICNKFYSNISSHLFSTHQISNKCQRCKKEFYQSKLLSKHLKCHPNFKCNECCMQFYKMKNLVMHVNEVHTSYYAFYCSNCGSAFSTASEFNLHMKLKGCQIEADMLPALRCELCEKLFLNRRAMRKHMESVHVLFGHLLNIKRIKPAQLPSIMYTVYKKSRVLS